MNQAGYEVTVWTSQYSGHITQLILEKASGYDLVVCSGGDGTLNETVSGLMQLPKDARPPLGYIPTGSTNDVAFGLQLPTGMLPAAKIAVSGREFPLDIGQFGERYFTYVAAFGAFTEVTYLTPQSEKNLLGHPAYILEGAKRLSSIRPMHVRITCGQDIFEGEYLFGMVSNAKSVGGMRGLAGKDVGLNDGIFEVTLIRKPMNPIIDYPSIVNGLLLRKTENDSNFHVFKGSDLTFEFDEPISWTLDGEFGGDVRRVAIKNQMHAIRVIVPK